MMSLYQRFRDLPIRSKLVFTNLCSCLIPLLLLTALTIQEIKKSSGASRALTQAATEEEIWNRLEGIRSERVNAVRDYLDGMSRDVRALANNTMTIEAAKLFRQHYRSLPVLDDAGRSAILAYYNGPFRETYVKQNSEEPPLDKMTAVGDVALAMQAHYIARNEHPLGEKDKLDTAGQTPYDQAHSRFHPKLRYFQQTNGLYDIFIAEPETGHIVYTVFKELDYGTSLVDGPYAKTGIGEAFAKAKNATGQGFFISDYQVYAPSYDAPAAFIATPIFDGDLKVGILIFQIPLNIITERMQRREGLGQTGETILVGSDHLMRSDSLRAPATHSIRASWAKPETGKVEDEATVAALSGRPKNAQFVDYAGNKVWASAMPLEIGDIKWALVAKVDEGEAMKLLTSQAAAGEKNLQQMILKVIGLSLVCALVVAFMIWQYAASLTRPMSRTVTALEKVAQGDLNQSLRVSSRDEFGRIAQALNQAVENTRSAMNTIKDTADREHHETEVVAGKVSALLKSVEEARHGNLRVSIPVTGSDAIGQVGDGLFRLLASLSEGLGQVASHASHLVEASGLLHDKSKGTMSQLQHVSDAAHVVGITSGEINESIRVVNNESDRFAGTIDKILTNSTAAIDITQTAVNQIKETHELVGRLSAGSSEITQVVRVISEIATRTELLSLNASIEAARVGEAGRGFAVLASEIKALANQTADATDSIRTMVEQTQEDTRHAVETISHFGKIVQQIHDLQHAIYAIVSDQNTAFAAIHSHLSEVIGKNEHVSEIVQDVTQTAQAGRQVTKETLNQVGEFNLIAEDLFKLVNRYQH